jgi:hypothetical protein
VAAPDGPEPRIVLRSLGEAPAPLASLSDAHRRAEVELSARLTALIDKARADRPAPAAVERPDPFAEARKDLDAYLAKAAAKPPGSVEHELLRLARVLMMEDQAKGIRVLTAAAAAARRQTWTAPRFGGAFHGTAEDLSAGLRVHALIRVAETAIDLKAREEGIAWLVEAEAMTGKLPELHQRQYLEALAVAWVVIDEARTHKLLAALKEDAVTRDLAVYRIIERVRKVDLARAVTWLDRFHDPRSELAQSYRSRLAVALAARELPRALQLAEGIALPSYRALTYARLATGVNPTDPRMAHRLIDQAGAALAREPSAEDGEFGQRTGIAIYVLWQAQQVQYADLASLVAIALTTRRPMLVSEHMVESAWSQTVQLAAGVGSLDADVGRALLGQDAAQQRADADPGRDYSHEWLVALALVDPAAANRLLPTDGEHYTAQAMLAVLRRRSAVIDRLSLSHRASWVREGNAPEADDD